MSKSEPRKYPASDVKVLYGLAAGRCAFSHCRKEVILDHDPTDGRKQIGKIAHIVGHSVDGPRGDAKFARADLDTYGNWVLLCPTCHDVVDALTTAHTVEDLRSLKGKHEHWVEERLSVSISHVGFAELEIITSAIAQDYLYKSDDLTLTAPLAKIEKNGLTGKSRSLIQMGLSKASEVRRFVEHMEQVDSSFPDRLKAGFATEYDRLMKEGLSGDILFDQLRVFSGGPDSDFLRQAAGLIVLTYLFERCEVFEK